MAIQTFNLAKSVLFARHTAHKFQRQYGISSPLADELESAACIGLAKALKAFDPVKSSNFVKYAYLRMFNEMKDYVRVNTILPRAKESEYFARHQCQDCFEGVCENQWHATPHSKLSHERLYAILEDETYDHRALGEQELGYARYDEHDLGATLKALIGQLCSEDETQILDAYYWQGMTLRAAGESVLNGVTESRACQVKRTALDKLRRFFGDRSYAELEQWGVEEYARHY